MIILLLLLAGVVCGEQCSQPWTICDSHPVLDYPFLNQTHLLWNVSTHNIHPRYGEIDGVRMVLCVYNKDNNLTGSIVTPRKPDVLALPTNDTQFVVVGIPGYESFMVYGKRYLRNPPPSKVKYASAHSTGNTCITITQTAPISNRYWECDFPLRLEQCKQEKMHTPPY